MLNTNRMSWLWLLLGIPLVVAWPVNAQEKTVTVSLGDGVPLELILIPAGTFQQGSPPTEADRNDDETPRETTISSPFYLGKFPVTRRQFGEFVKQTGYRTEAEVGMSGAFGWEQGKLVQKKTYSWKNPGYPQTEEDPVTCVTYPDALAFLKWASSKTRLQMVLPTESQWEYACRAGTTSAYFWGDSADQLDEYAWVNETAGNGTRPVGEKQPNAWGLHDMCGNVYQWCRDWFGPYDPAARIDPEQTRDHLSDKPRRVLRGGAFHKQARHLRSASRYRNDARSRNADNGFRVAALLVLERPGGVAGKRATSPPTATPDLPVPPPLSVPPVNAVPPPAARHADQGVPSAPARGGGSFTILGLLCCLGIGTALLIGLVTMAFKVFGGSHDPNVAGGMVVETPTPSEPTGPVSVDVRETAARTSDTNPIRIVDDGFWVRTAGLPFGAILVLSYTADGSLRRQRYVKRHEGPEAFIFTGATPTGCRIVEVLPPEEGEIVPAQSVPETQPMPPRSEPEPEPRFTGYPSAYS